MRGYYNVFPVHNDSFTGIATTEAVRHERVIRALDVGNITIHRGTAGDITFAVVEGQDFYGMHEGYTVTSTANILMS